MAWDDLELTTRVNPLFDYHRYWKQQGVVSHKVNEVTKLMMDLKDGPDCANHPTAIAFFSKRLIAALKKLNDEQLPRYGVVVPSSKKFKVSSGLCSIMSDVEKYMANRDLNFELLGNCLQRHKAVAKNASGGSRDMKKHFDSIRVSNERLNKKSRILLLDDVATTGNTIKACKAILRTAGAGDVIMLVLGQTVREEDDDA